MIFIKNGSEYPLYLGDLELENPAWELGQALPEGWSAVTETLPPEAPENGAVTETTPQLIDGVWTQSWETKIFTDQEITLLAEEEQKVRQKFSFGLDTD